MKEICLKPVVPNEEIMQDLENKGMISRLTVENGMISDEQRKILPVRPIYKTDPAYGAHMLLSVVVDRTNAAACFGYHPDKEDLLMIQTLPDSKPLYLIISWLNRDEIKEKIENETLAADDFIALELVYNDPRLSFFTMNPYVLHGEATLAGEGNYPYFYVTEPTELPLEIIDFKGYTITAQA